MHRTFTSAATRGSGGRKQIGWLSSLGIGPSPSAELLTKAARRELRDLELVAPVSFTEFRRLRNEYDVLILQAPIQLDGEKVKVIMAGSPGRGPIPVDAEKLTEQLADKSNLTWVVIETVANDCSMRTAQALRRLADELAQKIGRQVVALCHPRAYLHEFEIAETPNEEPPVFLVELLKQLPRTSLDDAAHIARKNVLRGWPLDEAGVGVPIVMRPQAPVAVAAEPSQRAGRRGPRL
jgi:hypothetical protein